MYKRILVPIDGSETSMLGLREAMRIAGGDGCQLCLFHVVNELVLDYSYGGQACGASLLESLREVGNDILHRAEAIARTQGLAVESVLLECFGGSAADLIVQQATNWHADLIVMGTHGRRGLRRLAMGSDAESVVRASSVPVLLVRGEGKLETACKSAAEHRAPPAAGQGHWNARNA
jgi:nucleotide-binding universal stress UspA family protein